MTIYFKPFYGVPLLAMLSLSMNSVAAPLALSDAPLPVSTTVSPNVMLLLDNSGSMDNLVWDAGYDSSINYPKWLPGSANWAAGAQATFNPGNLPEVNCASGYKIGLLGGSGTLGVTQRCLRIPSPEGNNTRYHSNYLQYLFETYGVNGQSVDLTNILDNDYQVTRMHTVKEVAKLVTTGNSGIKFGLAKLGRAGDNTSGGTVVKECQAGQDLTADIDDLSASTWTPIAEALYEVTRYFRGIGPYSSVSFPAGSPIEYRCQKNFTIVLTDGLPTYDTTFPTNDPDVPAGRTLQNWDNDASNDGPGGSQANAGSYLYLDDIAKFAWDTDFKTQATHGNDAAGISFDDAAFAKQNMYTYTVGFAVDNTMLQEAAEKPGYGHGIYYTATDTTGLITALRDALADITQKSGSSSSAAASTGRIQTGSSVYQARYDSTNWTGQFLSFALDTTVGSPTYGEILKTGPASNGAVFDAGKKIPAWGSRTIVTNKAGAGIRFRWGEFTSAERSSLFNSDQAMLQYLRGRNDSTANRNVSIYRERSSTNLGDIVHSTPYFVGTPSARYPDNFESVAYSSFVTAQKNRDSLIYVGANDGMLHAFDAPTGVEKMAFIPGSLLPELKALTDPDYTHQYYVDGSPTVVDAFDSSSSAWKTVLVGGLNKGGQGIYALDITNPAGFSEANAASLFMWEFTDEDDVDLGYSFSRPKIVKLQDGKWYAVFGNGYNNTDTRGGSDTQVSTTGDAVIYLVDLWDKSNFIKISTQVGMDEDPTNKNRPNGFATLTPVDLDGDQVADYIYGADLFGNVWKFNLNDASPANWALGYKLYSACSGDPCNATNVQPITTPVTVGKSKNGNGQMVYFGTGQYIEITDNNGASGGTQTFYGIHDKGATVTGRSQLLEQTITKEQSVSVINTQGTKTTSDDVAELLPLRETSKNYPASPKKGWYLDLVPPTGGRGERLISAPAIRGKMLLFVTNIPADDPCSPGGDSWLMSLDAFTGGRLDHTYDLDKSGKFSADDRVFTDANGNPIVASGIRVGSGGNSPSFMPGADSDQAIISGNDQLDTMRIADGDGVNRQSWQQIIR